MAGFPNIFGSIVLETCLDVYGGAHSFAVRDLSFSELRSTPKHDACCAVQILILLIAVLFLRLHLIAAAHLFDILITVTILRCLLHFDSFLDTEISGISTALLVTHPSTRELNSYRTCDLECTPRCPCFSGASLRFTSLHRPFQSSVIPFLCGALLRHFFPPF